MTDTAKPEPAPMTDAEYHNVQNQILLLGGMVCRLNVEQFVERAEHAAAFGCFFDPTLWIKGIDNLEKIKAIAQALADAKAKILRICPEVTRG